MPSTDRYQVVHVRGPAVTVPFADMVKFAEMHRCPTSEAAPVPDGHCQTLGSVGEATITSQPKGTARPSEDHPG